MKRLTIASLVMAVALLLSSCGGKKDTPEKAFFTFVEAVQKQDSVQLAEIITDRSRMGLALLLLLSRGEVFPEGTKYTIEKQEIDADKATLWVRSSDPKEPEAEEIHLVREEGKWKVDFE